MRVGRLLPFLGLLMVGCSNEETGMCLEISDTGASTGCPAPAEIDLDALFPAQSCEARPDRVIRRATPGQAGSDTGATLCCYTVSTDTASQKDCGG